MALFDDRLIKQDKSRSPQPQEKAPTPAMSPAPGPERAGEVFNAGVGDGAYTAPPEFKKVREEIQQFLIDEVKSLADLRWHRAATPDDRADL